MAKLAVGGSQKRQLAAEDISSALGQVRMITETKLDLPAKSHMTHHAATVTARIKRPKLR
jgi:hypothetical protein